MRIGELASRTDCAVETIRYYEREGLLSPAARSSSNYRRYDQSHVERLLFVRHCRSLDMTLGEIRALLALRDTGEPGCDQVDALIGAHLHHVEVRIRELSQLREQLVTLRRQCQGEGEGDRCGILRELSQPAVSSPTTAQCSAAGHAHVPGTHRLHD
ncbi:Cd(II)/Pb(II)-responsive transcriptional regulator [Pseudomonas oryzihabitans]|uniref:Cd(II)/Pb(II)-responsive transcriptional regulator n=1 Tax=Pseudomonas oryzihabitans TaxID=47885 RepID=UPI00289447B5|nr:Cd(II)/Pb(II)-responsive transcriptional regulator [Pseudomonas oryzihabitans]MDT3718018.1 Cd(II)/Pb(II)-responsive transcriptional regulator [Pseudomonas oryzihabitans]